MRLLAPAKINLYLRVGPPRADGFHPLLTWMCTVGLFDNLEVDRVGGSDVHLSCDVPGVPCDASNLVVKAAAAVAEEAAQGREGISRDARGLTVRLQKKIPVGAGLGGGSSDGARLIMGLNRLWDLGWEREKQARVGAKLGSDVPFFFHEPSAICRGRGELVTPVAAPRPRWAVLVMPGRAIATAAAYRRFDEMKLGRVESVEDGPDFQSWPGLDAAELLQRLVNDLEPAAFGMDRELGRIRSASERVVGRPVRMSGSGSSLFTLYDSPEEAGSAAVAVAQAVGVKAVVVALAPKMADDINSGLSGR